MFTDAPADSSESSSDAEAAASAVWWWVPQLSNQPFQDSAHISGPVGCRSRRNSRRSREREPNVPVFVQLWKRPVLDHSAERLVARCDVCS